MSKWSFLPGHWRYEFRAEKWKLKSWLDGVTLRSSKQLTKDWYSDDLKISFKSVRKQTIKTSRKVDKNYEKVYVNC